MAAEWQKRKEMTEMTKLPRGHEADTDSPFSAIVPAPHIPGDTSRKCY